MSRSIKLLLLLLVLQVGLVAWVQLRGDAPDPFEANTSLLSVDPSYMDAVVIEQQNKVLKIVRKDGSWVLPDKADFPVLRDKFRKFTDKLLNARQSWPVGTTMVAARQFKVIPDRFEKRVRFLQGSKVLGDVFLGSSPGFRKVHARVDGDKHTYSIEFNAFDAPVDAPSWYDRGLLKVVAEDIARIDMEAYALTADDGGFKVEGLRGGERTDNEGVRKVVGGVSEVGFIDILFENGKKLFDTGEQVIEYTFEMKKGPPVTHTVVAPSEGGGYILKSSAYPHYFKVARDRFDKLRDTGRVQLVAGSGLG